MDSFTRFLPIPQNNNAGDKHRQVDPGTFTVHKENPGAPSLQVGWCFVEAATPGNLIEHYALFHGYSSPTGGEKLIIRPTGPAGPDYASLSAFLDAMRNEQPPGSPYSYIESNCAYHSALP